MHKLDGETALTLDGEVVTPRLTDAVLLPQAFDAVTWYVPA
jgi:hypothetical protein